MLSAKVKIRLAAEVSDTDVFPRVKPVLVTADTAAASSALPGLVDTVLLPSLSRAVFEHERKTRSFFMGKADAAAHGGIDPGGKVCYLI
jgi:hypothetical protein